MSVLIIYLIIIFIMTGLCALILHSTQKSHNKEKQDWMYWLNTERNQRLQAENKLAAVLDRHYPGNRSKPDPKLFN